MPQNDRRVTAAQVAITGHPFHVLSWEGQFNKSVAQLGMEDEICLTIVRSVDEDPMQEFADTWDTCSLTGLSDIPLAVQMLVKGAVHSNGATAATLYIRRCNLVSGENGEKVSFQYSIAVEEE